MQETGNNDIALVNRQVSALTATPALKLNKSDARLALAIMWDFETWEELAEALAESSASTTGNAPVGPTDLLKGSSTIAGPEKAGFVARQVGRVINSMLRFPALSERVGVVIPTLYGYESMNEMAMEPPESDVSELPITSNDLILQSRRALRGVFTGERAGGLTLVSGTAQDQPIGFALDAALKLTTNEAIRVVVSEELAQTLDIPTGTGWRLQNYQSLSTALSSIISHLQHESNTVFVLSLQGFANTDVLADLIHELKDSITVEENNRVIIDTGPLMTVEPEVWKNTDHQVLLQGALDYYDSDRNHLSLKNHDLSQVTGFVSRAEESFSFYLLRNRRDGFLITSLEPVMGDVPPQACSA